MRLTTGRRHKVGGAAKRMDGEVRSEGMLRAWLESAVIWLLLLAAVASAVSASEPALFSTVLVAWALFPLLVGIKNTLDAGCFFMLIVVGIVGTVDLAQNGLRFLLP
jgi:hypothetical protein